MKTYLLIIAVLLLYLRTGAQGMLPEGVSCTAHLTNDKTIKNMKPWKLYKQRMEYIRDGSLHDLDAEKLNYLECTCGDYAISDSGKFEKIIYDVIVQTDGDSINCFISQIGINEISYYLPSQKSPLQIHRMFVKTWLIKGVEDNPPAALQKQSTKPVNVKPASTTQSSQKIQGTFGDYEKGKNDAKNEFRGNGSAVGGFFCGIIPFVGWIIAPITLAVPPSISPDNITLYKTNGEYRRGYKAAAHRKKAGKTLGGFACGLGLFLILIAL